MSDVHFISHPTHLLHKPSKRLALNSLRNGVDDGAKLRTITVIDTCE